MTESIFSVSGWQLLFTLINLVIDYFILKKFLYQPVKKMFAQRQAEVEDTYKKADEANADATSLKQQYEQKMAGAREEADAIVRNATGRAQVRSDAMIAEARQNASEIIHRADEQAAIEKKQALNQVKNQIADLALQAAENVIRKELDADSHRKMIDDFIENVGEQQWQN
ncbi:MAG TPA: F0F1 ATP synthase subunit B [Candidatus Faecivivens stercorigallinarum]|nr:F0F1 ATP synthase subunit B [Candidatus Faecivivens stercorigallinarum]